MGRWTRQWSATLRPLNWTQQTPHTFATGNASTSCTSPVKLMLYIVPCVSVLRGSSNSRNWMKLLKTAESLSCLTPTMPELMDEWGYFSPCHVVIVECIILYHSDMFIALKVSTQKQRRALLRYYANLLLPQSFTSTECKLSVFLKATRLDPENASYKENLTAVEQQLGPQPQVLHTIYSTWSIGSGVDVLELWCWF